MGTEPVESEIPMELDDLPLNIQEAYSIYTMLTDNWDPMGGNYLGKSFVGVSEILDICSVPKEERKFMLDLINLIDAARSEQIKASKPTKAPST